MKKFLSLGLLILLVLSVQGCSNTEKILINTEVTVDENEDIDMQEDYLQVLSDVMGEQNRDQTTPLVDTNETTEKDCSNAIGSCNSIDENSTCLEYYGAFWSEIAAKLNCAEGTFSSDPCPRDFGGGCNTGAGTEADMVVWMYTRGGGEITTESMKYAKMACNATVMSHWID